MKISIIILVAISICLASACSKPKPSADAISNALTQFITKDNPNAKLDGLKLEPSNNQTLIQVKFGYKDFTYTSSKGVKKTESGTGTANIDGYSGKWLLESVKINFGTPDGEIWNPNTEVK